MISILIVAYNSERCIGACLESLQRFAGEAVGETIVVDNGSADGTAERVRRFAAVKLIGPGGNLGVAAAVNRAAHESRGEALLLLTPDTICRSPLEPLEEALDRSE